MITKIEIKNFQSHKNTVLEFDKGVNVITGESDNGKSAVIRAIRWVVENYPSGTEKINSSWNEDFKESLSVKIYNEKGWVQRIRTKSRNGYTICKNDCEPVELSAVGRGVPKEVTEFLNLSDVNFQFQLDPPYLLSMTPGAASQYLNEIVHLDSIDTIMSLADSDKRQLSSEQKIVEKDIKDIESQLVSLSWVDDAFTICSRIDKLNSVLEKKESEIKEINDSVTGYENLDNDIIDFSEANKLISDIESVKLSDTDELERCISSYEECNKDLCDVSNIKELIKQIDNTVLNDTNELEHSIEQYNLLSGDILDLNDEIQNLKKQLPERCPVCGSVLSEDLCL